MRIQIQAKSIAINDISGDYVNGLVRKSSGDCVPAKSHRSAAVVLRVAVPGAVLRVPVLAAVRRTRVAARQIVVVDQRLERVEVEVPERRLAAEE